MYHHFLNILLIIQFIPIYYKRGLYKGMNNRILLFHFGGWLHRSHIFQGIYGARLFSTQSCEPYIWSQNAKLHKVFFGVMNLSYYKLFKSLVYSLLSYFRLNHMRFATFVGE